MSSKAIYNIHFIVDETGEDIIVRCDFEQDIHEGFEKKLGHYFLIATKDYVEALEDYAHNLARFMSEDLETLKGGVAFRAIPAITSDGPEGFDMEMDITLDKIFQDKGVAALGKGFERYMKMLFEDLVQESIDYVQWLYGAIRAIEKGAYECSNS